MSEATRPEYYDTLLKKYLDAHLRVLLVGPPGIGKTGRITDVAQEAGYEICVWRASLLERPDILGCFAPNFEKGVTQILPLEAVAHLQKTKEKTLLFLDDLGQAPIDVQASLMRLFDNHALSNNVLIWGATNRPGDKAGVTALCEPLLTSSLRR